MPIRLTRRMDGGRLGSSRVLAWLKRGGANVIETAGARNDFEISATVKQVDSLFQTSVSRYSAHGTQFLANGTAPSVPAHLEC